MSVTFYVENAPEHIEPCQFCATAMADGSAIPNRFGGCCDPFCCGHETHSEAPEFNLSNVNAHALLGCYGFDVTDLSGSVQAQALLDTLTASNKYIHGADQFARLANWAIQNNLTTILWS